MILDALEMEGGGDRREQRQGGTPGGVLVLKLYENPQGQGTSKGKRGGGGQHPKQAEAGGMRQTEEPAREGKAENRVGVEGRLRTD